jgi:tRNA uridine 5-carboxymethylaminomethyl modification enzyme
MFTSRAEMRLALRYDNADQRLTPTAREIGSVDEADYEAFLRRQDRIAKVKEYVSRVKVTEIEREVLDALGLEGATDNFAGKRIDYLARRPDCDSEKLFDFIHRSIGEWADEREIQVALNDIRYAGYLKDQETLARRRGRYDELEIPDSLDYARISGLSNEAVQKLSRVRPRTISQAARIPGITPAAVSILLVESLRR